MSDPRLVLEEGLRAGLHLGAQLYVSRGGETIFDFACGEARAGVPMRNDSLVQWFSSGKPLTAVLVAQLVERGEIDLAAPVSQHIPDFARNGKQGITLAHLLTHTAGIRGADKVPPDTAWNEMLQHVCDATIEEGWTPGARGGYSTNAAWFLLAEIIQRITGTDFDVYIKSQLLNPIGMIDSWLRLPFADNKRYGDRLALMHDTAVVKREPSFLQDAAGMAQCRPGSSARGPIRELGRFYEMLLNGGIFNGNEFLLEKTIRRFTSRQRTGLFDETFLHKLDFGYGFIVNSNRYGVETVPYGYGRYAGDDTYGHSGAQSSCAFADPQHQLVVAWVTNGTPGERPHQKRHRDINNAIYEYLGLRNLNVSSKK